MLIKMKIPLFGFGQVLHLEFFFGRLSRKTWLAKRFVTHNQKYCMNQII